MKFIPTTLYVFFLSIILTGALSANPAAPVASDPPSANISLSYDQPVAANTLPIKFNVSFNKLVQGFSASDISLAGSTANVTGATIELTGTGASYQVTIGNIVSDGGSVVIDIPAGAVTDMTGTPSLPASGAGAAVTFDNVVPKVAMTHVGTISDANGSDVTIRVTFSEPVNGYQAYEISFGGSNIPHTASPRTITGSGAVYDVTIHDLRLPGYLKAKIFQNAAQDSLGNPSEPSDFLTIDVAGAVVPTFVLEGRVTDPEGRPVRGATVIALDQAGQRRTAVTSNLGYYTFEALPSAAYTVTASSRRYRFEPRTIGLESNVADFDLVGIE